MESLPVSGVFSVSVFCVSCSICFGMMCASFFTSILGVVITKQVQLCLILRFCSFRSSSDGNRSGLFRSSSMKNSLSSSGAFKVLISCQVLCRFYVLVGLVLASSLSGFR